MNLNQILMMQLKSKNPQAYNQFNSYMQNKGNPKEFLNQITNGYTPEQMQKFKQFVSGFGVTEEQLNQFGINSK